MRITETAQQEPISSEVMLQAIQECSLDGFLLLQPIRDDAAAIIDFTICSVNGVAAGMFETTPEKMQMHRLSEWLPRDSDAQNLIEQFHSVVNTGEPVTKTVMLRPGDPADLHGLFRHRSVKVGDRVAVTLRLLSDSDALDDRLRLAVRASNDGFWDWRLGEEETLWWSNGFYALLGIPRTVQPSWALLRDLRHPDDDSRFESLQDIHQAGSRQLTIELRLKTAGSGYHWFRIRARGLEGPDGQAIRIVGSLSDVEEQKQAESVLRNQSMQLEQRVEERTSALQLANARLRNSKQMLEEHNDYLKDFAAFASHDLREPLRKIRAYGDLLQDDLGEQLGEDAGDYLSRMLDAAVRMQRLIDDLLLYSRSTGRDVKQVDVDLNQVVKGVMSDLEVAIDEAGATFEIDALPHVLGTPSQFRQVLQNLIANAIKYRDSTRTPHIRISVDEVELSFPDWEGGEPLTDTWHRLRVCDNGIGFEQRFAERIFQPFKRLNRRSLSGSGIGLAVCRRVIERHGGHIYATSTPGVGTEVNIILPRVNPLGKKP